MFKEIDLSRAVPPNAVAVRFRYEITGSDKDVLLAAKVADNAAGHHPTLLTGRSGEITVRFRTAQKLYYSLQEADLHLNLWIVQVQELGKHAC
ncbi:MAG: hypothetical protein ACE5HC_01685 [Candidatus Binatia bacterium]